MKNLLMAFVVLVLVGALVWFFFLKGPAEPEVPQAPQDVTGGQATTTPTAEEDDGMTTIGTSAGGRDIIAYHYGPTTAQKEVVFVGGIHGGYSPNTTMVAYDLMAFLKDTGGVIPDNVKVTVIPVMNPDGLQEVMGTTERFASSDIPSGDRSEGRFNGNNVDLNRNFDCDWQPNAVWQTRSVSGGTAAFSEPEAKAIRDYVTAKRPTAVVAYYAAAGGVFGSNCHGDILGATTDLTNEYAKASGYSANAVFDYYETTGDMTNWLAKVGIPAISVLLSSHTNSEWAKNEAGVRAVLEYVGDLN
jgi:hypothetical protein